MGTVMYYGTVKVGIKVSDRMWICILIVLYQIVEFICQRNIYHVPMFICTIFVCLMSLGKQIIKTKAEKSFESNSSENQTELPLQGSLKMIPELSLSRETNPQTSNHLAGILKHTQSNPTLFLQFLHLDMNVFYNCRFSSEIPCKGI